MSYWEEHGPSGVPSDSTDPVDTGQARADGPGASVGGHAQAPSSPVLYFLADGIFDFIFSLSTDTVEK